MIEFITELIPTDSLTTAIDMDSDGFETTFTIDHEADNLLVAEGGMGDMPSGTPFPDSHNGLNFDLGLLAFDYGDAPSSFATTLEEDGPRHVVYEHMMLGCAVDIEENGAPDGVAGYETAGDDNNIGVRSYGTGTTPGADEDGIR